MRNEAAEAGVWIGDEDGDFVVLGPDPIGITVVEDGYVIDPVDWTSAADAACY